MTSDNDRPQSTQPPDEPGENAEQPEVEGQIWRVGEVAGATLGRLSALTPDSREGLRSQEQTLAGYGINWTSDEAYDLALAEELLAAQRQRQRGGA